MYDDVKNGSKSEPPYSITAMNDSELDQLLRDSEPRVAMRPGFQREVWLRIETSETSGWKTVLQCMWSRIADRLALPQVATATCAAAVLAGVLLGAMSGKSASANGFAYVRSISPFVQTSR